MSHLAFLESKGVSYKDDGQTGDALVILKRHGLTCARLRLFTSTAAQAQADPYNYINNLSYNLTLAARVKGAGLRLLLDFHYSDSWADPQHQAKPAAGTNLVFSDLVLKMREYGSNTIAAFGAAGAMPDYVQVGNEITAGILWPDGANTNSAAWSSLGQLLNASIQGIKDAAGTNMPKIIVHIDRGGDWSTTKWFFDSLVAQQTPFDMIGESYYPWWHGSLGDLSNCLTNAAKRYGKPLVVAETAFPWTNTTYATNIVQCAPTVTGQVQYAIALAKVLKSVPNGLGAGIFWWAAEYQKVRNVNEAGFNTTSFFDTAGNLLPVADVFGDMVAPLMLGAGLSGTNLALTWPLSGAGASLLTTTSLSPSTVWESVTNNVQTNGTGFALNLPLQTNRSRFYRLRSK